MVFLLQALMPLDVLSRQYVPTFDCPACLAGIPELTGLPGAS